MKTQGNTTGVLFSLESKGGEGVKNFKQQQNKAKVDLHQWSLGILNLVHKVFFLLLPTDLDSCWYQCGLLLKADIFIH